MDDDRLLTSIAFQGDGALGAYATGALEYIYERFPGVSTDLRLRGLHRRLYGGDRREPS